ncbi:MAG: hypothetical protein MI739_03250 [Bacteroidales bacterium]|nr:hypothetical protein [Bacteroidales bacterium]
MKNLIKQLTIILLLTLVFSCDKKDDNIIPNINSYPMKIGTEWTYVEQCIRKHYKPKTSILIKEDTITSVIKISIAKDTLFSDTMKVKVFNLQKDNSGVVSREFNYLDDKGFKTYAYSNEDIHIEDKPALNIKFPLNFKSSWTYKDEFEHTMRIDKKVIGSEQLNLFGQNFSCFKVAWKYSENMGFETTDWISNKGLVKRIRIHDKATFTTFDGKPIGLQITEKTTLKSFKVLE